VACDDARVDLIECKDVRPEALGALGAEGTIDELALQFDARGLLVNMTTYRTRLSPAAASDRARAIVARLAGELGPANERGGGFEPASLGGPAAGSVSTVMYRYRDYVADVTAMNAPSGGPTIREHYMSAREDRD
jgi:hypothetical protein